MSNNPSPDTGPRHPRIVLLAPPRGAGTMVAMIVVGKSAGDNYF